MLWICIGNRGLRCENWLNGEESISLDSRAFRYMKNRCWSWLTVENWLTLKYSSEMLRDLSIKFGICSVWFRCVYFMKIQWNFTSIKTHIFIIVPTIDNWCNSLLFPSKITYNLQPRFFHKNLINSPFFVVLTFEL